MRSVLSELVRQDRLVAVEKLKLEQPKTRDLVSKLNEHKLDHVLILVKSYNNNLCLAARNLPWVNVLDVREIDLMSLMRFDKVLATSKALKAMEEHLS